MAKTMLIDAAHPEETRVVVLDGNRVDDFDFETQSKKQLRGNIYLAKVTRVEPSLQAAFVEYGGNRHGFLAFGEIHPDYYAIPIADREALKAEFDAVAGESENGENGGDEEDENEIEEKRRRILSRRYKIQEVIKRKQIMLVQVVKEERGNKGAALTTYLSLAGRYCVLMPNTGRGGGISRKITNATDRKRLKKIAQEMEVPQGMGLIVRTAGAKRTKTEIKRDYEYLSRAWETIRDTTLRSVAPALIYEESSLVKRAIRDLYDKDVDNIQVEGEGAFKEAKDFIRMLMPSHAKKAQLYKEPTPIFTRHGVERHLESIFSPTVTLRSGGYIVINQTEALVSIDVNSGRATRERNIEQTALKTNLEAAEEAARQMRLRDLAGLIVIDFIDMEEAKNDRLVERKMKDALRFDRARVQMGKISGFGLLELSRQRRRTGILEGSSHVCPMCTGLGRVRSIESSALLLLRSLDEESLRRNAGELIARAPTDVALYLLNEKRAALASIEDNRNVRIRVVSAANLMAPDFEILSGGQREPDGDGDEQEPQESRGGGRRDQGHDRDRGDRDRGERDRGERDRGDRDRGDRDRSERPRSEARRRNAPMLEESGAGDSPDAEEELPGARNDSESEGEGGRRRRRGRRGGKQKRDGELDSPDAMDAPQGERAETRGNGEAPTNPTSNTERGSRRRRRRRGRGRRLFDADGGENLDLIATDPIAPPATLETAAEEEPYVEAREEAAAAPVPTPVAAQPAPIEAAPPPIVVSAPPSPPVVEATQPSEAGGDTVLEQPDEVSDESYEPDLERREKFFARLNRWGKKT